MKKPICFYIFLLIFLTSCQPILRVIWRVKKPKHETEMSLKTYLKINFGYLPKHSYTLDSLDWRKIVRSKYTTFPDLFLFDKKGNRIQDKGFCIPFSQNFVDTLISIHKRNFIKTNDELTFQNFEKMFRNYKGQNVALSQNKNYKGILIWAAFLGKGKGLKQAKRIITYVKSSKYKIKLYFLNVDMQKYWEQSNQE